MICTAQTVPGRLFDTVRYREGQERSRYEGCGNAEKSCQEKNFGI